MNLEALLNSIKTFAQEGTSLIFTLSLFVGVLLGFFALKDLVKLGDRNSSNNKTMGSIGLRLVIASCLITLAQKIQLIIATNGNVEPVRNALSYAQGTTSGGGNVIFTLIWATISMMVVFFGVAGVMRGFILLDKASQGGQDSGDTVWRAVWHIIGGALCISIFS
jgi:hypothetical protein